MDGQPQIVITPPGHLAPLRETARQWQAAPAALSQFVLIPLAGLFAIWAALKNHGIETPCPHRMVDLKGCRA